jgi:hypothetical protein
VCGNQVTGRCHLQAATLLLDTSCRHHGSAFEGATTAAAAALLGLGISLGLFQYNIYAVVLWYCSAVVAAAGAVQFSLFAVLWGVFEGLSWKLLSG